MPRRKRRSTHRRRRRNARGWFKFHGKGGRKAFSHPTKRTLRRKRRHNPVALGLGAANPRRRRHLRRRVRRLGISRRRNPFQVMGRKGSFGMIPDLNTIKDAAVKGIGAVASDVIRATGYSLIGRNIGMSIAEDAVARLVSGWLTGTAAGFVLGAKMANDVYEGCLTVALYELVADAAAVATSGKPKLFGFVSNPYAGRAAKPFLPGISLGAAPAMAAGTAGLFDVVPEGQIVPVGSVVPEGEVLPLGNGASRFVSRF